MSFAGPLSFAWPIALLGLVLVALALIAYVLVQRRRRKYVVRFTNFDLLENIVADSPRWRRHIPAAFALLALTALVIGMARPQVAVAVAREEATVILAMDSSGSMTATDVTVARWSRTTCALPTSCRFIEWSTAPTSTPSPDLSTASCHACDSQAAMA
jgi:Ca-activated chloride channel family protein